MHKSVGQLIGVSLPPSFFLYLKARNKNEKKKMSLPGEGYSKWCYYELIPLNVLKDEALEYFYPTKLPHECLLAHVVRAVSVVSCSPFPVLYLVGLRAGLACRSAGGESCLLRVFPPPRVHPDFRRLSCVPSFKESDKTEAM